MLKLPSIYFLQTIYTYKIIQNMPKIIFEKKNLRLREDDSSDNSSSEVTLTPNSSEHSSTDIASDLQKAQQANPNAKTIAMDSQDYNGNNSSQNQKIQVDVNGDNTMDATRNMNNQILNNPTMRSEYNKGNVKVNFHMNNESIVFKKSEMDKFLKDL